MRTIGGSTNPNANPQKKAKRAQQSKCSRIGLFARDSRTCGCGVQHLVASGLNVTTSNQHTRTIFLHFGGRKCWRDVPLHSGIPSFSLSTSQSSTMILQPLVFRSFLQGDRATLLKIHKPFPRHLLCQFPMQCPSKLILSAVWLPRCRSLFVSPRSCVRCEAGDRTMPLRPSPTSQAPSKTPSIRWSWKEDKTTRPCKGVGGTAAHQLLHSKRSLLQLNWT